MRKVQKTTTILYNRAIGPGRFLLSFRDRGMAQTCAPGQFLMVRITDTDEPLLRRPFGVHSVGNGAVAILYESVGTATRLLSKKRPGDEIGVIGPLGNGFDFGKGPGPRPVLVAGGMGVAPLFFLAEKMTQGRKARTAAPLVLLGAKDAACLLREKDFRAMGCEVRVATDDGSKGFRGYVTRLLEQSLDDFAGKGRGVPAPYAVYACGPAPMLKDTRRITCRRAASCQVSLEAHMSCGFGACLGCMVNTVSGYKRVCREGPVFNAEEIAWP